MPSQFSTLKIELIASGEQSGTWGFTTNNNLGSTAAGSRGLEQAIVGKTELITADFVGNVCTFTYNDTNDFQDFRALVIVISATLTGAGTINVPAIQKPYIVMNNSVGGYAVTVKVSGQPGVSVPNGAKIMVYNDGTDVGSAITHLTTLSLGTPLSVPNGGTGLNSIGSANQVIQVNPAGTALQFGSSPQSVFTSQGDMLYASAASTLAALPKDVNATRYLSNRGTFNNPSWSLINLTNGVENILPPANGGTNSAFFTVAGPTVLRTYTFPDANTTVAGVATTQTLTNKRVTPRVDSITSASTITPTSDTVDQYNVTALAVDATMASPSGTPTDGQKLIIRIKDNGTGRALTWNAAYRPVGVTLPIITSANKVLYFGCIFNTQDSYWDVVAFAEEA